MAAVVTVAAVARGSTQRLRPPSLSESTSCPCCCFVFFCCGIIFLFAHTESSEAAAAPPHANQPANEDSLHSHLGLETAAPAGRYLPLHSSHYKCCSTGRESGGSVEQIKGSEEEPGAKFLDASSAGTQQVKVQSRVFLPWKKFRLLHWLYKKQQQPFPLPGSPSSSM